MIRGIVQQSLYRLSFSLTMLHIDLISYSRPRASRSIVHCVARCCPEDVDSERVNVSSNWATDAIQTNASVVEADEFVCGFEIDFSDKSLTTKDGDKTQQLVERRHWCCEVRCVMVHRHER